MRTDTELLIIGAGPYGLSAAAYAKHLGLDYVVVGEPMGFWKRHMPDGMLLRSGVDWHLDALGVHTFRAFLQERRVDPRAAEPIPVAWYVEYADWFQEMSGVSPSPSFVEELRCSDVFEAVLSTGERVRAANVVAAPGIRHYAHVPTGLVSAVLEGRSWHTCDLVDFAPLRGKRCLIVGGRQSAFEWAALIGEQGASEVHVVYRHATPEFAPSQWSWVDSLVDQMAARPGWFRALPPSERDSIARRFWAEGRLKLEPWLWPRLQRSGVTTWPRRSVAAWHDGEGGDVVVDLDDATRLEVDAVIFATGYQVDVERLPFLSRETIVERLRTVDGFPALDDRFQSSVPGLFFPGLAAARDFGPFFGFVRGCPVAARIMVDEVARSRRASGGSSVVDRG